MPTGKLVIEVRAAREALPINEALVRIKSPSGPVLYEARLTADQSGMTQSIELETPELANSSIPDNPESPYATYHVEVFAPNFRDTFVNGVQVFPDVESILDVEMLALPLALPSGTGPNYIEIEPPALRRPPEETEGDLPEAAPRPEVFEEPFIPEYITVHLGRPSNTAAKNVTVRFPDYIKNVCCSEIYPTWPEEALKANIYAQISLALNRVFTEWYRSRGYDYDITNSTAYDQYFVAGRNIYENINNLVNEIFNVYIRKPNRIEPFYAEYCNGTTATCAGMSQWGSYEMARGGATAEQILNNYYGELELVETNDIRGTEESYPGYPLREGSRGEAVRTLQLQLVRIAINYPSIPLVTADGIFGPNTTQAVRKFQQIFNLTPDGIVGKGTWYQISRIYVGVKKLAELTSEGERPDYGIKEYPGTPLRRGSQGIEVVELQYYLSIIGEYNENISQVAIDGRYGVTTEQAVRNFQKEYVLPVDGVVGEVTWNKIIDIFGGIMENVDVPGTGLGGRIYPGSPVSFGDAGGNVRYIQNIINAISPSYPQIPTVSVDGEFGVATQRAIIRFQQLFGLTADGVVGRNTWNELNSVYRQIQSNSPITVRPFPGTVLRLGSRGSDVLYVQRLLNSIRSTYPQIPFLTEDGVFGSGTQNAVRIFQNLMGIAADGVVGQTTWNRLNAAYTNASGSCIALRNYPGTALRLSSSGSNVTYIQQLLNTIRTVYTNIPSLTVDGIFGSLTQSAVRTFQNQFGLTADGVVGSTTWNRLNDVYSGICGNASPVAEGSIISQEYVPEILPPVYDMDFTPQNSITGEYIQRDYIPDIQPQDMEIRRSSYESEGMEMPRFSFETPRVDIPDRRSEIYFDNRVDVPANFRVLKVGMMDNSLINVKRRLYALGYLNSPIGINTPVFGASTKQALENFQSRNGLTAHGILDEITWNMLFRD